MPSAPFADFARFYDRFMLYYVDYNGWVDYVEKVFRRFKCRPQTILDVACGTGIPSVMLARRGYRVVGVDRSPEMLAVLRGKIDGLPISCIQSEITDFRVDEPTDAAISLYDSINYLLTEEDLAKCFSCVRQALKAEALFTFDMNTVYSLSTFWGTRVTERQVGPIKSVWQNVYDDKTRISTLYISFWEDAGDGSEPVEYEEVHRERAYTPAEVKERLVAAGFRDVRFYSHGTFLPVGPLTTRMMVVARAGAVSTTEDEAGPEGPASCFSVRSSEKPLCGRSECWCRRRPGRGRLQLALARSSSSRCARRQQVRPAPARPPRGR